MESTAKKIENKIRTFKRGKIFFPDDFVGMGTSDTIRQNIAKVNEKWGNNSCGTRCLLLS